MVLNLYVLANKKIRRLKYGYNISVCSNFII